MMITSTAISFSLFSAGLAFCGIRFFKAFQKIGGSRAGRRIGILLSALFLSFALKFSVLAVGALFFVGKPEIFYALVIAHLFLALISVLGIYLVFYILFPSISPWPAVVAGFTLGMVVVALTILIPPRPFIDASGGVDWNLSRQLAIPLSYLLFFDIGTVFVIFTHSFLQTKTRGVKVISLIQMILSLIGIVNVFIRFLFPKGLVPEFLRTRVFDVTLATTGVIFLSIFLLPPIIIGWLSRVKSQ